MTENNAINLVPKFPTSLMHVYGYGGIIYNGNVLKAIDHSFNTAYEFSHYARLINDSVNDCYQFEGVLAKGSYQFLLVHDTDTTRGIVSLFVNDVLFGTLDCYSASRANVNRSSFGFYVPTSGNQTFKIKVTSKNSSSVDYQFGCSAIFINPTPDFKVLVNCGGSNYTDSLSRLWIADTYFSGGNSYDIESYIGTFTVTGTSDPTLYKFERSLDVGSFTYTIPVAPGVYNLKLHFCENNKTSGQRVGTVTLNGSTILSAFDIFVQAGGQHKALVKTFANQSLSSFLLTVTNTLINGIELVKTG